MRKYVRATSFSDWGPRRTSLGPGTRHGEYVRTRWQAGVREATLLWQDLQAHGYRGTLRSVQRAVRVWRDRPVNQSGHLSQRPRPATAAWDHRPPSPARAAWLLLRPVDALTPEEQLRFWQALNEPPRLTDAQRRLGSVMRGEP